MELPFPGRRILRPTLVILPKSKEIGFAYFEHDKLLLVGVKRPALYPKSSRTARFIAACVELLDEHEPGLVILPRLGGNAYRHRAHALAVVAATAKEGYRRTDVITVSWREAKAWLLVDRGGKHAVHRVVASLYPELGPVIPPRKNYQPKPYAAIRFDTVAIYAAWRRMPEPERAN